jgi:hypothetical protein
MSKGRKVPADGNVTHKHAMNHGLILTDKFSTEIQHIPYVVIEVDTSKYPAIRRLISAANRGELLNVPTQCTWNFLTAASGTDEGKTFIILTCHIDPPYEYDFDLVFVDGEDDSFFDDWRRAKGRFILGNNGQGIYLVAPIDLLAPGVLAYKTGLGLIDPITPTA